MTPSLFSISWRQPSFYRNSTALVSCFRLAICKLVSLYLFLWSLSAPHCSARNKAMDYRLLSAASMKLVRPDTGFSSSIARS